VFVRTRVLLRKDFRNIWPTLKLYIYLLLGRVETERYSWSPGLPFNVILIQFIDNLQCGFSIRTLIPRLSSLGGITLLVYLQMRCLSSFPKFWLLRCSWERWAILLQYGSWDWGHFLLFFFLDGFCTFTCGSRDFAPLHKDYNDRLIHLFSL
jgi:hypothetical protein